jgi:hypothetical protein
MKIIGPAMLIGQIMCVGMKTGPLFLQLVGCLWNILLNHGCTETHRTIINQPSKVTFDATEIGNFHLC